MSAKAPRGFQPDDAEKQRVNVPPIRSRYRKEDLYSSVLQFKQIDDHAIQVSQTEHDNFADLIWHLVYSINLQSDLDKARAIFRWMTSKNMYGMTFRDGATPGSPEEILLAFRSKQGTYARIFEVLCRFAGLQSMILTGYAKGLDYRPGNQFKSDDYNHSWNAVLIDRNWYLVDSHWATRYLVSEKNMPENLVYEYDDFYFLTDPEQLIYSHWSQTKEWQLLDQPITLHEFESMPLVKSYFFKCAMHFVSHRNGVIDTKNGLIALTLGHKKPTNFTYKITFADSGDEMYQGEKLKNYALLHHSQNQTGTLVFRAPKAGQYYFSFFSQLLTGEVGVKSTFTAACEFKVVADTASAGAVPLPICSDSSWGPGLAVEQLGLIANPPEGVITTSDGQVCLEFRKTKEAFVLCKLRRNGMEEEELEKYIRDKDLGSSVQVTIHLPSQGEYGIEVYGNDPAKDGDTYTHICQYFVHFATPSEQQRAFYQESPERRATMEGFTFTATASGGYQPGSMGLDSATANLHLSDPENLPPPPPELLQQQHFATSSSLPDTRHQQQFISGTAPDTYQQQQYVSGNVIDQRQQPVVSQVKFTPARSQNVSGGTTASLQMNVCPSGTSQIGEQMDVYAPGSDQKALSAPTATKVVFTAPGQKDVYALGSDQKDMPAPTTAKVVFTTPGQKDIYAPDSDRRDVNAPDSSPRDVYASVKKVVYAPDSDLYISSQDRPSAGRDTYAPDIEQRDASAPAIGQKTIWTPSGQKTVYAPGAAKKNVWTPGSPQRDSDSSGSDDQKVVTSSVTVQKNVWPPGSGQKDSDAPGEKNIWKPGREVDTDTQKVGYAPAKYKKPTWPPSSAPKDSDTLSSEKKSAVPPPTAKKPTWTPGSVQRDTDAPGQKNVWTPGSAQRDSDMPPADQKNTYAAWTPGSGQRDADAPAVALKSTWTPGSPQKNVWTPDSAQRDTDAPGTDRRDIYAPGTDRKDVYAPGTDRRDIYAPGTDRRDIYAPGTDRRDIYAPGTDRRDIYAPGTDRKDIYAPGTDRKDIYAPGTDRKDIYAPGTDRKDVYAPGTDRRDIYAPGSEPKSVYAPGQKAAWTPGSAQRDVDAPGMPYTASVGYTPSVVQKDVQVQPQKAVVSSVAFIPASTKPLQVQKRSVGQAPPTAPHEFQLMTVDQDKGEAPPPAPAPEPQQKPTLQAIDQIVLQSVDDHAIQVSKCDHNSFRDLVWDLIYSKNITNEIEKVRVVFRWLASKNLKEMNFDHVEKGSPEEVLMGLKTGATTYAMLFDIMCNYAGLHSKIIGGYAKGADYVPGMKFNSGQNQHTWNAIYIYGTWCLIDAHWGARRLVGKQTSSEDFHYQLDEYFFLPDPHQLIYTHFPDDPRWQLLDRCVTLEEFENMPHMKPQFFKFGMEFVTHRNAIIRSRGEVQVRLRYPAKQVAVAFNFTIQFENGDEEYKGTRLSRYGMQDNEDGVATFTLRLPTSASYILFIYAKEDTADKKENVYSQVCEYKVEHETQPGSAPEPFPPCSSLTWGPCSTFYRYGLSTTQQSPVIHTCEGKAQLQIQQPRPMQLMARLKHNNISDSDLESYVMQRTVGNTIIFDINAPGRGEYGLEVFANDPATEGQTLYHNAQYLLVCQEDVKTTPLPKLPPGYLGPQPRFSEFGMSTMSHQDPVIHVDTNVLTVVFKCQQPMRLLANLIAVEGDKDFSNFTFSNTKGSNTIFSINIPQTGFFKLQIYGTPVSDKGQQIPGIYNYLVNCRQVTQAVYPFPKQYAQWKEGCFMAEPVVIPSRQGPFADQVQKERLPDTITFRVEIPGAKSVAVVVDTDWTHLEKAGVNEWSGNVSVGHCYGTNTRVTLNANYGADKTNYATLLEYFL